MLWEIAKLHQLGRIELEVDAPEFRRALSRIRVWPLDPAVCIASTRLDIHTDPADELIAATSPEAIARRFTRARVPDVTAILDTLAALGQARRDSDGYRS